MLSTVVCSDCRISIGKDECEEAINQIVQESAVQRHMEDKGGDRQRAEELAEYMLESYAPW
jgi:hypothetical protein